ncbi:MAG: efflux RND transporter periplasmic adaptor subunit [Deltaproteobacteria bacterium]|nr:efflux RND transporter periplasmic adaptor subunit [Deltaproteobacteria bacterium]
MKGFRSALAITAVLAVLSMQGCSGKEAPKGAAGVPAAKEAKELKVGIAAVEGRTVERNIEATGTLAGWDEVIVSSEAAGTVKEIKADLGDKVKSGEVLAVLDPREASLGFDQARAAHQTSLKVLEREKATLEEAKNNHERYEELFKREMVSASQYDDMRTRLDVASARFHQAESGVAEAAARLALAEKRLADTVIKSPIEGEVSRRAISAGEYVSEKTQAFIVVSTATLKFKGTVAEASVPRVKAGQDLIITVEAFRDRTFKGRLTRISPSVDVRTRTLEVEASVPNPQGVLKPGFFARGLISVQKESGVAFVPEAAVYSFIGINKVFVIDGQTARERMVSVGAKDGSLVEIKGAGVKPGQNVATSNLANLYEGAIITIQK